MAEIIKTGSGRVVDYMARDYDGILRAMRELIPAKLPDWTGYRSEADFGNVLLQLFAHMGDILSYYQDRIANESFLGTARTRRSVIQHLRLIGYRLSTAVPASATLTLTVPASRSDTVTIARGNAFATKSGKDSPSVRFEYTGSRELAIDLGQLPVVGGKKHFIGVPVEEGRLFRDEELGESDGKADQRFPLARKGVILRALDIGAAVNSDITLKVVKGGTAEEWAFQESLAFSRGQKDFSVEIDEEDRAVVVFGDGSFGEIPPKGAGIFASYRVGGGLYGNVTPDRIRTIVEAPQLSLLGAQVTNPEAATGGSDRESIEHAVRNAPAVFRSLKRAVTKSDYEALALRFKGVGKVRAEAGSWNRVTLYVAPDGGGRVSDLLRANLLAYFEDKRPLTTIIEISDVEYVKVHIGADIETERYYNPDDVTDRVRNAISDLLSFDNVNFRQMLYLSKFYEAIEAVDGVNSVMISEFRTDLFPNGYPPGDGTVMVKPDGKIEMGVNEIPAIGNMTVNRIQPGGR